MSHVIGAHQTAAILIENYDNKFCNIVSDLELVRTAKQLAQEHFYLTDEKAQEVGIAVLKEYGEYSEIINE